MKQVLRSLLLALLFLCVVIVFRVFTLKSKQVNVQLFDKIQVNDSVISRLQQAVRYKTISYDNEPLDTSEFIRFQHFLEKSFPLIHAQSELEIINNYSLLFHLKGKKPTAQPIILMAHQDVVPIEESSRNLWEYAPFSGKMSNGFIWGRGAVDDKGSLMAILEAVEKLLSEGFQLSSDLYIALGHNEEAVGNKASRNIATLLKQRNIRPAFVLDEGGEITDHEIPGLNKPVALVGIAEKGYITLKLDIILQGGHSSMPKPETAIDVLAKAIVKLKENPFPATINPVVNEFMQYMGPEMPIAQRMAFANQWLFSPLIKKIYSSKPGANATIRTTTAFTLFQSGIKENVVPASASATLNFRTLPGTSWQDVIQHVKNVIKDDRIKITPNGDGGSSDAIADVNDKSFAHIQKVIRGWKKDILVTPFLVLSATDGRFFTELTPQVYRFIPFKDIQGFHGVNERVGIKEYKDAVRFYYYLIKEYKND